jgi:hypothetical protein
MVISSLVGRAAGCLIRKVEDQIYTPENGTKAV